MFQFKNTPENISNPVINYFHEVGSKILSKRYTHVAAYHGCRPKKIDTYKQNGILPSNVNLLLKEIRTLFSDFSLLEGAIKDIGPEYLEHNHGKIGLLVSATWAKSENNEYSNGSELIRAIVNRLGPNAATRFYRTGKPTWIKCAIPLNWLDYETTFPIRWCYIANVFSGVIRQKMWPNEKLDYFDQGFLLKKAIPSENILEFIDAKL